MYYKVSDIPNYVGYNVEYKDTNIQKPTFNVEITQIGEHEYRVVLKDIVLSSNTSGGTVSYKMHDATNWILNGEKTTFTVNVLGLYDIKFTDRARKLHSYAKKYR